MRTTVEEIDALYSVFLHGNDLEGWNIRPKVVNTGLILPWVRGGHGAPLHWIEAPQRRHEGDRDKKVLAYLPDATFLLLARRNIPSRGPVLGRQPTEFWAGPLANHQVLFCNRVKSLVRGTGGGMRI
ncbi:predicted protein [Coccidioides posadasii str. Silveira]|uniref:Predicted protein n=1 Tax=Coccidioides posadasii (strain RMSCC 757 / Silveira) TaxID=443226 RepID=E9CUP2_COCPS|nr:predicted protein [Coccidioides posadasii str. Silveira]